MLNKKNNIKAFTLIELIVVITILAILWTVGFISLKGYSNDSKNAVKKSDVANIEKALWIYKVNSWEFPEPVNWTNKTYKWANVWKEGDFDDDLVRIVWTITKSPVDPSTWENYKYSKAKNVEEYQVLVSYSNSIVLTNPALANDDLSWTKLYWNYNWKWVSNWTVFVTAPSLFSSTTTLPEDNSSATFRIESESWTVDFDVYEIAIPASWDSAWYLNFVKEVRDRYIVDNSSVTEESVVSQFSDLPDMSDFTSNTKDEITKIVNTWKRSLWRNSEVGQTITLWTKSWSCGWLPTNATFFWDVTTYSVTDVDFFTPLTANYNATPTTNTCQFKCNSWLTWNWSICKTPFSTVTTTYDDSGTTENFWSKNQSNGNPWYGYQVLLKMKFSICMSSSWWW